ncbi:hypothetical protein VNO77_17005 [Canavalia gladiata]|uniref:Uncharacterized protein n=1 Tax=Canavalia gladiata TaxID=3824 RepID=A0AAN9LLU3_CANGL
MKIIGRRGRGQEVLDSHTPPTLTSPHLTLVFVCGPDVNVCTLCTTWVSLLCFAIHAYSLCRARKKKFTFYSVAFRKEKLKYCLPIFMESDQS